MSDTSVECERRGEERRRRAETAGGWKEAASAGVKDGEPRPANNTASMIQLMSHIQVEFCPIS